MSLKSKIQDMKGELLSMSRRGFGGFRSRSQRVVQDTAVAENSVRRSCWANMPPELLRDVLMRIEASEDSWPCRRSVVACAGVCKSWREIMRDIVQVPEISSKLTFPISLKQPGPRDALIQCFVRRDCSNQIYHLYLNLNAASNDDGKFLLVARKCRRTTCTEYIIYLNAESASKSCSTYIGKLRSNFLGTNFLIYDSQPPNPVPRITKCHSTRFVGTKQISQRVTASNYPVADISYDFNVLGSRGPRRMQCIMDSIPASAVGPEGVAPTQLEFLSVNIASVPSFPFFRSNSTRVDNFQPEPSMAPKDKYLVLKNKAPRWHEQLQCWCLDFNGRVTVASVKNFQLVISSENNNGEQEQENTILQFGKVGNDVFTMDYKYPISAFQAFAICLSSFDTKLACQW